MNSCDRKPISRSSRSSKKAAPQRPGSDGAAGVSKSEIDRSMLLVAAGRRLVWFQLFAAAR